MSIEAALDREQFRRIGCVALAISALAAVVLLLRGTAADIVDTWYTSSAFNHGFLIIPICLYLAWRRRVEIATTDAAPDFRGLLVIGLACLSWLVGHITATLVVQEYSLVVIAEGVILTMFGWPMCRKLIFPLGYLYFAVPSGQDLVPPLRSITATIAVDMLKAVGLPVFADGNVIAVPNGVFYVAEACSGISFLIASMALGVLFAGIIYRSWWRRVLFLGFAFTVPIVANGIRAFGIILIAYLSSNQLAMGIDHIIYGWIFFTFIVFVTLVLGMSFRDGGELRPLPIGGPGATNLSRSARRILLAAVIALAPVMLTVLYGAHIDQGPATKSIELRQPDIREPWHAVAQLHNPAASEFASADAELHLGYESGDTRTYLEIGYYRYNRRGAQAVSSMHNFAASRDWVSADTGLATAVVDGQSITVRVSRSVSGRRGHVTWYWYWVDGRFTSNPYYAKLLVAMAKLLGGEQASAIIAVSTYYDDTPAGAEKALNQFTAAVHGIAAALGRASGS